MKADYLIDVQKPARYAGGEWGAISPKDEARLTFVFAYPETYEVGMSYLGLQILYSILNAQPEIQCARAFAPWADREQQIRSADEPLRALEGDLPVGQAEIVGFSLQHEIAYTNVLLMLDLARIPLRSKERTESHPLIVAGGPCVCNPAPMSPFIDAFVIGEAEESVVELANTVLESKDRHASRSEILHRLARIPGVFVPSLYQRIHNRLGEICFGDPIETDLPKRVSKRTVDATNWLFPTNQIVPSTKIAQHRLSLEIMRGCARGCRFCQAGFANRPLRERPVSDLLDDAKKSLETTGYDEVSLLSLSSGDYSRIRELTEGLIAYCEPHRISVSLPSLRMDGYAPEISRTLERVRGGGMTFAPEAGTERLRNAINKPIDDNTILETVRNAVSKHWSSFKTYFMIGLPSETDEDIEGIIDLSTRIRRELNDCGWRRGTLHVSVGAFSPKPHTPFQWCGQIPLMEIRRRLGTIRSRIRQRGIKVSTHSPEPSVLEAALARGDIRLADVIERAYRLGARFDGWSESFQWEIWQTAFIESSLDPAALAEKSYEKADRLPWEVVDLGLNHEYLWREYQRTFETKPSQHCGERKCRLCGVCDDGSVITVRASDGDLPRLDGRLSEESPTELYRYRLEYRKHMPAVWLSHQDLLGTMDAIFRRAGIRLSFSKGFHPHPKIVFGSALSVGVESEKEYLDILTEKPYKTADLCERLNAVSPAGIVWTGAWSLQPGDKKITSIVDADEYLIHWDRSRSDGIVEAGQETISELGIARWSIEKNGIRVLVPRRDGGAPRILNKIDALKDRSIVPREARVKRVEQLKRDNDGFVPVMEG